MSFSKELKSFPGIIAGVFLTLVIAEGYVIIDQAVTIAYMKDGLKATEEELTIIITLINTTDFSKNQIVNSLENNPAFDGIELVGDTVQIDRYKMIFVNKRLVKIFPI